MLWALAGVAASILTGTLALRAGRTQRDYHSAESYGMSPHSHRRFAALCLAFAAAFGLAAAWPLVPVLPVYAAFVLAVILYGTSFLRGYADEDS